MTKKNIRFICVFLCLNLFFVMFVFLTRENSQGHMPSISFDQELVTMSVGDEEDVLLKGVKANDAEDGDISDDIFIYDISSFDENMTRTVTYAVFDSDSQMATASRQVRYEDYSAPRFSSSQSLMNLSLTSDENTSYMSANSCVDGNITNKISLSKVEEDNHIIYRYSVTDSTGTSSTLEIRDEISMKNIYNNSIDIELSDYILYVEKGFDLDPEDCIMNVNTSLGEQNELIPYVDIETNYDADKIGTYEVKYTLNRSNGDYGVSKMFVVVEDNHE